MLRCGSFLPVPMAIVSFGFFLPIFPPFLLLTCVGMRLEVCVCVCVPLPGKGFVGSSEPSDGFACLRVPFGHQVVGSTQLNPLNSDALYLLVHLERNSFHFSTEHPGP